MLSPYPYTNALKATLKQNQWKFPCCNKSIKSPSISEVTMTDLAFGAPIV